MAREPAHDPPTSSGSGEPHHGGRLQRQVDRLEGLVQSFGDAMERIVARLDKYESRADETRNQIEQRLERERDSRKLNLGWVASWVGVLFGMLTTGFLAWSRPAQIEAEAARDMLELRISHQDELSTLQSSYQAKWELIDSEVRVREVARYDAMIDRLMQRQDALSHQVQSAREAIDHNRATADERYGLLRGADADLLSMVRSGMKTTLDGLEEARKELQVVRERVIAGDGKP